MMLRICAASLICVLLCACLDGLGFKSKGLFATLCALILFALLGESLSELFSSILGLAKRTGITDAATCALRVIGLGYIYGITSDICDSLGERAVAGAVTAVGRIQIFLVSYPYFEKIINLGLELIK